jgi:hypothetical protein
MPRAAALAADITMTADAPSLRLDALAAVMVPPFGLNAGFSVGMRSKFTLEKPSSTVICGASGSAWDMGGRDVASSMRGRL